jgi:hypothetical protein
MLLFRFSVGKPFAKSAAHTVIASDKKSGALRKALLEIYGRSSAYSFGICFSFFISNSCSLVFRVMAIAL